LATPERLRNLPRTGNYTLKVDYCSDERHFEQVRGTARSWARIRDNISAIVEASDLEHVRVMVTDMSSFAFSDRQDLVARFAAMKEVFPRQPAPIFGDQDVSQRGRIPAGAIGSGAPLLRLPLPLGDAPYRVERGRRGVLTRS
jgi:hypothetical protein